jgi:hypothetical protein
MGVLESGILPGQTPMLADFYPRRNDAFGFT